jgi:hypothetical protein
MPTKSDDYHGMADYVRTQPDVAAAGVRSINIELTFDEALRLSLAIQSCLLNLNRYNRPPPDAKWACCWNGATL